MIIITYNPREHSFWNNLKNIGRILFGVEMKFNLSLEQAAKIAAIIVELQRQPIAQAAEQKKTKKK